MRKIVISVTMSLFLMAALGLSPGQAQNQKPETEIIKGGLQKGGKAEISYLRGLKAMEAGRYIAAANAFKEAISVKADYPEAFYQLGLAYARLGKNGMAIKAFKNSLRLNPDFWEAKSTLAEIYAREGQGAQVVAVYKKTAELQPKDPHAQYLLGVAYDNNGQREEAIDAYKKAVALNPNLAVARFQLALAYLQMDDTVAAAEQRDYLTDINPAKAKKLTERLTKYPAPNLELTGKGNVVQEKGVRLGRPGDSPRYHRAP